MAAPVTAQYQVTIGAGASLSSAVDLIGVNLCGFILPAGWTTAKISFAASAQRIGNDSNQLLDSGVYVPVQDSTATELTFGGAGGFAASVTPVFSPLTMQGIRFLKLRSGTSAAPTVQVSAVTVTLLTSAEPV